MTKAWIILGLSAIILGCTSKTNQQNSDASIDAIAYVDPMLGVDGGNVFGGVSLPFSMMRLGPDVQPNNMTNGYRSNKPIKGFSHTHLSGTGGGPRYGNFLVIPQAGKVDLEDYVSIVKENESSTLGHYQVTLKRKPGDVIANLSATEHAGIHDYEFHTWGKEDSFQGNILIDVSASNTRGKAKDHRCTGGNVQILSDTEVSGWASFVGGWGGDAPYTIYFHGVFDTPFDASGVWENETLYPGMKERKGSEEEISKFGVYASFDLAQNQHVRLKMGISFLSEDKAKANLSDEIPHWDLDAVKSAAESQWNEYLNTIQVKGGSLTDRKIFYSLLKNTLLMPTNVTGENPHWNPEEPHFWEHYCLWDVFRTVMPLHTLIYPDHQRNVLNSLLSIYDNKGWLPDAWIAGNYADIQGGTNADVVFADAIAKGLGGFDEKKAYAAILKNATTTSDQPQFYGRYLANYQGLGYMLPSEYSGAVSRSLEYAYNDFCISQVAMKIGDQMNAQMLLARSKMILDLFYASEGYFWGKDSTGNWMPDFSLTPSRPDHWNDPFFYEGGSRIYSDYVPHAMTELIERHGGYESYEEHLDEVFADGVKPSNEQVFLLPYLYHYIGKPSRTTDRVSEILKNSYSLGTAGLPGQDDSGAVSSWYVWSAMGMFPVAGQPIYLLSAPIFDETKMRLETGSLKIVAKRETKDSNYISSVSINGKKLDRSFLFHDEIIKGGELVITLSETSDDSWVKQLPPSY
ncbi:MAG: glycoside hydrolase family 92 protein [Ekhidna sp.]|nr:glycoside hydrolase family 92 protein [Ekhidna sp.]